MNIQNILFPLDFSESSMSVKKDVEWLAKKFNSTVTLLYVFEIPPAWFGMGDAYVLSAEWLTEVQQDARKRLESFEINLPMDKVKRVFLEGKPSAEIYGWCKSHKVDVVAMATHGHGAIEGLMMGSVAAKVLHNVTVPVWLRPQEISEPASNTQFQIVCGIDLADETMSVLNYAKQFADALHARVTLVHSVPEPETRPNKYMEYDLHKVLKDLAEKEIAVLQRKAGTDFDLIVAGSGPEYALAEVAREKKANLILIGRGHSRKFLGRFRTHALDLLGMVPCPVFSYCQEETPVAAENPMSAVAV